LNIGTHRCSKSDRQNYQRDRAFIGTLLPKIRESYLSGVSSPALSP
jgi:hypothetical protein